MVAAATEGLVFEYFLVMKNLACLYIVNIWFNVNRLFLPKLILSRYGFPISLQNILAKGDEENHCHLQHIVAFKSQKKHLWC